MTTVHGPPTVAPDPVSVYLAVTSISFGSLTPASVSRLLGMECSPLFLTSQPRAPPARKSLPPPPVEPPPDVIDGEVKD